MQIEGKVAIVTGGASGLGEACVRELHALGAKVAIFDLSVKKGLSLQNELTEDAIFVKADVTSPVSISKAVDFISDKYKRVDININCAGIAIAEKTINREGAHTFETFKKVIDVNLLGTFNTLRLCAAEMAQNQNGPDQENGVIINTSSVAAQDGQKGQLAYSASKGGVASMTLPISRDLARDKIRCCAVAPGLFLTPLFESLGEDVCDNLARNVLFPRRLGKPKEFAQLVIDIIKNPYLNGELIRLDGGIRLP